MIKIKDIEFEVENSYLFGYITEGKGLTIAFNINIKINPNNHFDNIFYKSFMNKNIRIFVGSDSLITIKPYEIKTWHDISEKNIGWEGYKELFKIGIDPEAHLHIIEFDEAFECVCNEMFSGLYNCKIQFKSIDDELWLKLDALCNIELYNKYFTEVPVNIETKMDLEKIYFDKETEEQCKKKIKEYFELDNFYYKKNEFDGSELCPIK